MRPSISVVCFTHDPPHRVAAALAPLRQFATEIIVAVDDRVEERLLGPLIDVADHVTRAEFASPLESNLKWLHEQASCEWTLRLDGDEVVGQGLIDRLSNPGWDTGITHGYVTHRWLWPSPRKVLAQPPWWPDPSPRLFRNISGLTRFPTKAHEPAVVAGHARFFEECIYHLDLLLSTEAERSHKVDHYERSKPGHRIEAG